MYAAIKWLVSLKQFYFVYHIPCWEVNVLLQGGLEVQ